MYEELTLLTLVVSGCDVTLEDDKGVIQSPGYGVVPYPNMVDCTWTIKSKAPIHLVFGHPFELDIGDSLIVSY